MIRFADLFAGIGGIRLGFEQACAQLDMRSECSISSEIDPKARETYRHNFGDTPAGDIRLLQSPPQFDFLLAGFPCQPFSYAGKQAGFGDTRGTLFFEVERLLRESMPSAFLLENVRGLTTHDDGRTFATILEALENLGYGVRWLLLNSSEFGVPQNRVRLYVVGIRGAKPHMTLVSCLGAADSHSFRNARESLELLPSKATPLVKDILQPNPPDKYRCSAQFEEALRAFVGDDLSALDGVRLIDYRGGHSIHSWDLGLRGKCTEHEKEFMEWLIRNRRKAEYGQSQDGKKLTLEQIESGYSEPWLASVLASLVAKGYLQCVNGHYNPVLGNMSFEVYKFLDPNSISVTVVASDAHRLGVVQNNHARRVTPRECARLQGFPDTFTPHDSDTWAYHQLGNSVAVPVVRRVVLDLLQNNPQLLRQNH